MNPQPCGKTENKKPSGFKNAGIVGVSIFLVLGSCFIFYPRGPYYAGRPVSAWFDDLCIGYSGGMPSKRFDAAYEAFTKMDSDVVPYLIAQLNYDRSGFIERMFVFSMRIPLVADISKRMVSPSGHRSYAAVALGRMGPKAESAVPALLERWIHDNTSMNGEALVALHSILIGKVVSPYSPENEKLLEAKVMAEAIRRYPREAAKLGIN